MLPALIAVIPLALVDSINPSALAVTALILTQTNPTKRSTAYLIGVYAANFLLGVVLLYGISQLITPLVSRFSDVLPWLAVILGMGAALAALFWRPSNALPATKHGHSAKTYLALFTLGFIVTAYESPTALPYVAATTYLAQQQLSTMALGVILFLYNILFILPPLILLFLNQQFGSTHSYLVTFKARFTRLYPPLIRVFIFVLGGVLMGIGIQSLVPIFN